jgi:GNAT superfamily N-acetyltransferase
MSEKEPIKLYQVTADDIPHLAQIAHNAFANDRHTQLKALNPARPYNHGETKRIALHSWLKDSTRRYSVLKAVDIDTARPVGWICWGYQGVGNPVTPLLKSEEEATTKETPGESGIIKSSASESSSTTLAAAQPSDIDDPLAPLNDLTSQSMQYWKAKFMPEGARCMYIASVVVDPLYTGRGIGRLLVTKGTDEADVAGVYCWVQSSDAGKRLFEACGFGEIGRLELDLDEWVVKVVEQQDKRHDPRWDRYVFRYMRR